MWSAAGYTAAAAETASRAEWADTTNRASTPAGGGAIRGRDGGVVSHINRGDEVGFDLCAHFGFIFIFVFFWLLQLFHPPVLCVAWVRIVVEYDLQQT